MVNNEWQISSINIHKRRHAGIAVERNVKHGINVVLLIEGVK